MCTWLVTAFYYMRKFVACLLIASHSSLTDPYLHINEHYPLRRSPVTFNSSALRSPILRRNTQTKSYLFFSLSLSVPLSLPRSLSLSPCNASWSLHTTTTTPTDSPFTLLQRPTCVRISFCVLCAKRYAKEHKQHTSMRCVFRC